MVNEHSIIPDGVDLNVACLAVAYDIVTKYFAPTLPTINDENTHKEITNKVIEVLNALEHEEAFPSK
jgi:hypothetical protein